jgi:hypothetical protein
MSTEVIFSFKRAFIKGNLLSGDKDDKVCHPSMAATQASDDAEPHSGFENKNGRWAGRLLVGSERGV